jgi:hypothetical protein
LIREKKVTARVTPDHDRLVGDFMARNAFAMTDNETHSHLRLVSLILEAQNSLGRDGSD